MYHSIYVLALCVFLVGCSTSEKAISKPEYIPSKDDIFIDEPQADMMIDDSVVDKEFTDVDEYSGNGPDDEDGGISGSGGPPTDENSDDEDGMLEGSGDSRNREMKVPNLIQTAVPITPTIMSTTPSTTTTSTTTTTTTVIPVVRNKPEPTATESSTTNVIDNNLPDLNTKLDKLPDVTEDDHENHDDKNKTPNETPKARKADEQSASIFSEPGLLAAVIGGAVVGLLCAILLVMFIVYRMRKKDEGSYPLDEPKRSPTGNAYARNTNKEFYA